MALPLLYCATGRRPVTIPRVSIAAPCLNEAETVREFYRRVAGLADALRPSELEIVLVDDGSTDGTGGILDELAAADPRLKVLHLAENRGHQVALLAGMDFATGDIVVTLDADLQDPPEVIPAMLAKIAEGHDVVHGQRRMRKGESVFKRLTAWAFYRILRRISGVPILADAGDFRAFTRPVLEVVRSFRTENAFLRGTFASVGFRQCLLPYDRDRRYAGRTKYPLGKMVRLATDAMLEFSAAPVRTIVWASIVLWALSLVYTGDALYKHFVLDVTVPGWTSLTVLLTFFTGLILFSIAVIGSYVGRIFLQVQSRPLYWLRDSRNVPALPSEALATAPAEVRLSQGVLARRTPGPAQ